MASSSPQPPSPQAPALLHDEIPVPPRWQRKLVPRKGKGQTPKKCDVMYIAPDGKEIKTKTQLQRYLKGHPGGPAISEFNWSSGDTPRRSTRLTSKIATEGVEAVATPKRPKRGFAELSEETSENQTASPCPPKRSKKGDKETVSEVKNADVGPAVVVESITGKEESMLDDEQEENSPSGVVTGELGGKESCEVNDAGPADAIESTAEKDEIMHDAEQEFKLPSGEVTGNLGGKEASEAKIAVSVVVTESTAKEEIVQDAEQGDKLPSGAVAGDLCVDDLESDEKPEDKVEDEEKTRDIISVEEKLEKLLEQDIQTEQMRIVDKQLPENISMFAMKIDGKELPERMSIVAEEIAVLDELEHVNQELEASIAEAGIGEPLDALPAKSIEAVLETKDVPQVQDSAELEKEAFDSVAVEALPEKREHERGVEEDNPPQHNESSFFTGMGVSQDNSTSQEDMFCSPASVGVTN